MLATRQHGVVARTQLLELGLGRGAIDHRVAAGRLLSLHHGVYAVGHAQLSVRGRWMAAVLACGPEAFLSHSSAAALWGLLPVPGSRIHVTTPGRRRWRRAGIALHRVYRLHPDDRAVHEGIRVTTVARTLADLAAVVPYRRLVVAFEQSERLRILDIRALEAVYDRVHRRPGVTALGRLLADARDIPDVRSALERRFLDLVRREKLPEPVLNGVVAGLVVDALWQNQGLVVELDGFTHHRSRPAFERDRRRDEQLQRAGYRVLRITHRRLEQEPAEVAEAVRSFLAE